MPQIEPRITQPPRRSLKAQNNSLLFQNKIKDFKEVKWHKTQ